MSDVKDILGVAQKGPGQAEGSKPAPTEKKPEKPKWMSREAFALLDTSHPIAPSALDSAQNGKLLALIRHLSRTPTHPSDSSFPSELQHRRALKISPRCRRVER